MNTEKVESSHFDGVMHAADQEGRRIFEEAAKSLIGRRVKEARGLVSQKTLADLIDVHVNTIGKIERGDAVPDAIQLHEIGRVTKTNPAWLLCGDLYEKSSESTHGDKAAANSADLVLVRGYDVKASAGNGSQVNDENVMGSFAFKREWLARKGLNPQNLAVVTARGDSMEPTVRDGDILLVDRNVTNISADGIYLIERDNELYCKRLQRKFDGGVTIMSDSPRYEAQHLSADAAEDLHVAGRVIWIGGDR